jgi:ribosomal protein S12 methylthiotransferase accessory factor
MVHTAYTTDLAFDRSCFLATSTGLASGNHLLEAGSHGICEVVERDAGVLWASLPEPDQEDRRIDLDSIDHSDCRALLERYERAGIGVAVWDLTSAVGIAAFHCLIGERQEDPVRRLYAAEGAGCHPARHIALLRALTEAAQSRLTAISGARDDMLRQLYIDTRDPATLLLHRRRLSQKGFRRFSAVPSFESDSFEEDVAWELDHLRRVGLDRVIVVDLSRPELGLPVARVVIPGLEMPDSVRSAGEANR